jgi:hypothetical protein
MTWLNCVENGELKENNRTFRKLHSNLRMRLRNRNHQDCNILVLEKGPIMVPLNNSFQ